MSEEKKKKIKVVMIGLLELSGSKEKWCYIEYADRKAKKFKRYYSLEGRRQADWLKEIGGIYTVDVSASGDGSYWSKSFEHTTETIKEKDLIEKWRMESAIVESKRRRKRAQYTVNNSPAIVDKNIKPLAEYFITLNHEAQDAFITLLNGELREAASNERVRKLNEGFKEKNKKLNDAFLKRDDEIQLKLKKEGRKLGGKLDKAGKDAVKKYKDDQKKKKVKKKAAAKKGGK